MKKENNDPLIQATLGCAHPSVAKHRKVLDLFQLDCIEQISNVALACSYCLREDGKILFFGNGGSAALSQHLVSSLVVRFQHELSHKALSAISLTNNESVLTAISNDWHFDELFSRQIEAIGRKGDVAMGISTSGHSPNVIKGLEKSRELGLVTCLMSGADPGPAFNLSDWSIIVPSEETARIQEMHLLAGHILCEFLEDQLLEQHGQ